MDFDKWYERQIAIGECLFTQLMVQDDEQEEWQDKEQDKLRKMLKLAWEAGFDLGRNGI